MGPHEDDMDVQRQRLGAWLEAWELEQRLESADAPPDYPAAAPAPLAYTLGGRLPEAGPSAGRLHPESLNTGDIILLPPDNEATRARPVYVALAGELHGGAWLAVPFGRFPVPALPGELATGRAAAPLQVLCVWNRAPVAATRLLSGWQVGRLNEREQRWLRQLLDLPPGHNPGKSLVRRLGPPLVHPLDPRHDYIEEERMLWQEMETDLYCGENTTPYNITDNTDTLPLAAEEVDDTYQEDKG